MSVVETWEMCQQRLKRVPPRERLETFVATARHGRQEWFCQACNARNLWTGLPLCGQAEL